MNDLIQRPDLADLAKDINAEHDQFEQMLRAGLDRTRRAGELLLQAKEALPHGRWQPWLQANIKPTPRTAQRYMRIARAWAILEAKSDTVSQLTFRDALALLAEPTDSQARNATVEESDEEEDVNDSRPQHVPVALAHYHAQGLLDDASLDELLALEEDYGPEVVRRFEDLSALLYPVTTENAWAVSNALRPLEHPTLWPLVGEQLWKTAEGEVAAEGLLRFLLDARARGGVVPQWEITATWWASQLVLIQQGTGERTSHCLTIWRESFETALVWTVTEGFFRESKDPEEARMAWGYWADLRHAGVLEAAKAIRADNDDHPALRRSLMRGHIAMQLTRDYPLPSNMQGRLERLNANAS